MSTSESVRPYHHGGLREELVTAALGLLEAEGEPGLSLRGAARRAGVSAMAPYRHFQDKAALLAAVAARGFDTLADRLEAADASEHGPGGLAAQGTAYVAFAVAHPALFRLMFTLDCPRQDPALGLASSRAYGILSRRAASLSGRMPAEDLTLACWALVHGLAALINDGRVDLSRDPADVVAGRITAQFARLACVA